MKIKPLILVLTLVLVFGLAACTRSASESPTQVPGAGTTQTPGQQPPSDMGTAAGGGFASQTAQAAGGTPGQAVPGETPGETPLAPTTAPGSTQVPGATAPPSGGDPTAAPPAGATPVAPVAPTATAAVGGGCTSPYTVQAGEWVWSIGRKCNILPQAIIDANNLACYYVGNSLQCPVYAGDKLVLPANAPPFVGP